MKIISLNKKGKYVLIKFDNDLECKIHEDVFIESKIRRHDELTQEQVDQLNHENDYFNAKNSALRSLSRRSHSIFEIKIKLKQKGFQTKIIEKVIGYLIEINFLDDNKFAEVFYLDRLKSKKESSQKIRMQLFKKGVDREIISEIETNYYDEEQLINNAIELGRRKLRLIKQSETELKRKQKIYSFLKYRGFSDMVISSAFIELKLN